MYTQYAKALYALQGISKYALGRIIREVSHEVLRDRYGLKYETRTWHNQRDKILTSGISMSEGARAVIESGVGTVHLDHQPSIKVLKDQIIASTNEAAVLAIVESMDFQFLLPEENYQKG